MKMTTTRPTSGEFIAIWEYGGSIWSDTFRWEGEELEIYDCSQDEWDLCDPECLDTNECSHYVVK